MEKDHGGGGSLRHHRGMIPSSSGAGSQRSVFLLKVGLRAFNAVSSLVAAAGNEDVAGANAATEEQRKHKKKNARIMRVSIR